MKGAYLNAELHNDIHMNLLESHEDYDKGYCKINKLLYGQKADWSRMESNDQ